MAASTQAESRNPALDGIRGVAVLAVVLFHATMTLGHRSPPIAAALRVSQAGWLGVEVFFALSGFLITGILLRSKSVAPRDYFGSFFFRRALRILPLYFGVLVVLLLVPHVIPALDTPAFQRFESMQWWFWLHAANLAWAFHGVDTPALEFGWFELTHFWTLAVEEHFYFVWPLLVYFMSVRRLAMVAVVIVAVSVFIRAGIVAGDSPLVAVLLATPKYLSGLAIGGLAAIAMLQNQEMLVRIWLPLIKGPVILLGIFVFGLVMSGAQGPVVKSVEAIAVALVAAFTCMLVCLQPSGRVASVLSSRALVIYGKYSYGIYVYH